MKQRANKVRQKHRDVRSDLLRVACKVFADKGYRKATIAEICKRAGVNIAAVNYYFRSKEKLYVEAWRAAFKASISTYRPDGGVGPDAPPEQRLRGRILSLMRRAADPDNLEFDIVNKELANPTGLLAEVMHESVEPIRRQMNQLVSELLGGQASKEDVLLCQMSIIAQCLYPLVHMRNRNAFARSRRRGGLMLPEMDVEKIAEHVVRFSLAGIREMRRRIEAARERATE